MGMGLILLSVLVLDERFKSPGKLVPWASENANAVKMLAWSARNACRTMMGSELLPALLKEE